MGTHTPKKWYGRLEEMLANATSHELFLGSIWKPACPKGGMKISKIHLRM